MSEEQILTCCPRCQTENRIEHNFCWLCGVPLRLQEQGQHPIQRQRPAGSAGAGIAGVLAGAMGGIAIGFLIVFAFIAAILNAIGEMFDGCASAIIFLTLASSAAFYSIASWIF